MVLGFVANFMSKLKWTEKLPESEIVISHRGAPRNRKKLKGDHITEIRRGSFTYMDFETEKETHIPMHRVLEIWMDDKNVWKKRNGKAKAASRAKKGKTTKPKARKTKVVASKKRIVKKATKSKRKSGKNR